MPNRKKENRPTPRHIITAFHNARHKTPKQTLQASKMKKEKEKKIVHTKIKRLRGFGILKSNTRS